VQQRDDFVGWFAGEHDRLLVALALISGDAALARRATGATMLRASQRQRRILRSSRPRVRLYAIALHELERHPHRRRRRARHGSTRRAGALPAVDVRDRDVDVAVAVAVSELADYQRLALVLWHVAGFRGADFVAVLGLPARVCASTLDLARRRLGERLATRAVPGVGGAPDIAQETDALAWLARLAAERDTGRDVPLRALHHDLRWRRDRRRTALVVAALAVFVLAVPFMLVRDVVAVVAAVT
jgi:DNA-directed RNA polymerase specialized sigma24 family protein